MRHWRCLRVRRARQARFRPHPGCRGPTGYMGRPSRNHKEARATGDSFAIQWPAEWASSLVESFVAGRARNTARHRRARPKFLRVSCLCASSTITAFSVSPPVRHLISLTPSMVGKESRIPVDFKSSSFELRRRASTYRATVWSRGGFMEMRSA